RHVFPSEARARADPWSAALQAPTPPELAGEPDGPEVVFGPIVDTRAAEEVYRLMATQRKRRCHPQPHVLRLLTLLPIDGGSPARVVGAVEGGPEGVRELVDEVPLKGIDRILLQGLSAEEVVIVREERDPGNQLHGQRAPGLRHAKLRLDGPAVGPDVQELARIVLTERRRHLQAGPDDEVLPIRGELVQ